LVTADADNPADFNRKTSDGVIALFRKDNTTVGSIGTLSGDVTIDGGSEHTGLRFEATDITPRHNGAASDGVNDLGTSAARFKDLYLSGGVQFGTTGAAAQNLDDYEEGTWNVGFTGATVSPTITKGRYTKIGRVVYFSYYSGSSTIASAGGQAHITGLPFTVENNTEAYQPLYTSHNTFFGGSTSVGVEGYVNAGNTNLIFTNRGTTVSSTFVNGSAKFIMVAGFYLTTA
jgi:hypothetical protein